MVEARIKSTPDEDLQYRSQEVRANNKTIVTPIKALDPGRISRSISINKKAECISELYAGLSSKKILDHMTGSDSSLVYDLNRKQRRFQNPVNGLQLCFLEFKDEGLPKQKEIEYMTDQAYVFSDITPLPMLYDFIGRVTNTTTRANRKIHSPNRAKFERIKKYLGDAIETIEQLNTKPIMGYIPNYRYFFDELVKLYVDHGINTFYFDAHLSNPITLHAPLRAFLRELSKNGALEGSFIHMINPGYGRGIKDSTVIPAKDILGFGLGVDSLGEVHMRPVFNPQVIENMKKNPDNRSRLFDKDTYGYLKTSDKKEIKEFYPNDSGVGVASFLVSGKPDPKIQNAFNAEQIALESMHVRNNLLKAKPILKYLDKKSNVMQGDVKILKRAKIKPGR